MKNDTSMFRKRLKYHFDNLMSKGPLAVILWLGIISLLIVIISAAVIALTGIRPEDAGRLPFHEAAWQSLMRTFDAGTMGGDSGWGFRWIMLFVTLGGIFIVSALIGIINNAISDKIESLRKGRSQVMESNHTLILGWSSKIFSVISELVVANENKKKARIVILAPKDKVEMEDEISTKIPETKNTRVICRNGSPMDPDDLSIVNPCNARSIIILAPEVENPDIHVIKTVLALTNNPSRANKNYHIVSEIRDDKNLHVAKMVGRDEAIFILNRDIISRMIVQTSRQSGMSVVFTELLDFDGDEIYFAQIPDAVGKTFREVLLMFRTSAIIGIHSSDNISKINPPMDTVIRPDDKLIAIAEDDDKIIPDAKGRADITAAAIERGAPAVPATERTLILGWNQRGISIVNELDNYVMPGSFVCVVADLKPEIAEKKALRLEKSLNHQSVKFVCGDASDRSFMDSLDVASYDHIIVLSNAGCNSPAESDAITLVTLLHLRDIAEKSSKSFNIVSEMMDVKSSELASVTKVDDFIVSHKIISLLLSQLSENKFLKPVFDDLFDADGSEIYIKPVTDYVKPGQSVNFYTLTEAAASRNEVAIGYRIFNYSGTADKAYGVVINPDKEEKITFSSGDKLIVIAEN